MSRKRKKEDRAKTQLKKPKTAPGKFLPKGTNETKTEFKVTKIVIPGQQINDGRSSEGPTTSKNIGIKDVLHKLTHFSQAVRTDGLDGLKELLSSEAAPSLVATNLSKIVTTLVTLVQDREKKIRKQSVSMLGLTLGHVSSTMISPLYPLMSAHVSCCLTNIDPRIQQDGLTLLDTLINQAPEFVERHHSSIIPNCLDQISNKKTSGSKGPNVAANVSENLTALQWRLAVLTRVNKILDLAIKGKTIEQLKDDDNVRKEQIFKPNNLYPLVGKATVQHFPLSNLSEGQSNTSISDNIHLLMPLLIETWVEARASDSKSTKSSNLSSDSCDLLLNIAGIMDKLLMIASQTFDVTEGVKVLSDIKSKFWNDIRQHFLSYLPYRSPNTNADRSSALLCCVNMALDQDISAQVSEVAVKMCASKHVPVELKIRISKVLLSKVEMSNELRENLISSLTNLSQKADNKLEKQSLLKILQKEAEVSPDENAVSFWIANLPDQILNCDDGEKQELLNICLHLVQRNNKSLANKLLQSWTDLTSSLSHCSDNEQLNKTLGFVEYYCKILTA